MYATCMHACTYINDIRACNKLASRDQEARLIMRILAIS